MPKLMRTLNSISRCQSVFRGRTVDAEDLYPAHYAFVLAICHAPGRSQEELARALCLDKSTVARSLACMEKHGYITRTANESDRRQFLVYPTEKMLDVCPRIQSANKEWNDMIEEGIPSEELEVFYRVLSRMEESARKVLSELEETE